MDTSVTDTAWYIENVERFRHRQDVHGTENPAEPHEPPKPPPRFTWRRLPPQVLATVLDPHSSPAGVRLAMGTAAYVQQQMMMHESKVALLGLREMADMAGIHKDSVATAEARQQTIVRVGFGTPLVIMDGHGDASAWTLVSLDDPQPISLPVDPDNRHDPNANVITDFFDPAHRRWSTKKGGMTSRSYWVVLALLLKHGLTTVNVTTAEAAALVGVDRSTASRTLADIVAHMVGDARRTANGLEIELDQMLEMDWGGYSDRIKEAARKAERAKWRDWQTGVATRNAKKHLSSVKAEPRHSPEFVAWVEAHQDEMVAIFRNGYPPDVTAPEPAPERLPAAEPIHIDPGELAALRDRVRGIG